MTFVKDPIGAGAEAISVFTDLEKATPESLQEIYSTLPLEERVAFLNLVKENYTEDNPKPLIGMVYVADRIIDWVRKQESLMEENKQLAFESFLKSRASAISKNYPIYDADYLETILLKFRDIYRASNNNSFEAYAWYLSGPDEILGPIMSEDSQVQSLTLQNSQEIARTALERAILKQASYLIDEGDIPNSLKRLLSYRHKAQLRFGKDSRVNWLFEYISTEEQHLKELLAIENGIVPSPAIQAAESANNIAATSQKIVWLKDKQDLAILINALISLGYISNKKVDQVLSEHFTFLNDEYSPKKMQNLRTKVRNNELAPSAEIELLVDSKLKK